MKKYYSILLKVFFFCCSLPAITILNAQQTFSFSNYSAGSSSYTKTVSSPSNTMTVTYSESANNRGNCLITDNSAPCFGTNSAVTGIPFFYNSTWPSTAWEDYSSSGCYCYSGTGFSSGLALAANWTSNAASNYEQIVIQFRYAVCAPVNFTVWNVNQGNSSSPYPFTDNVDISALDQLSAAISNITVGNTCGNTVTSSSNTVTIKGVANNCANCANDGSGSHSVSIGLGGQYIGTITLKYYPSNNSSNADPSSQYVIFSDISTSCNTILPVQLLYFNVTCEGPVNVFSWATASETNNNYFSIEESRDGISYSEISKVTAAGTTTTQKNYRVELSNTEVEYQYFRLKQTDFDGQFSFSNMVASDCSEIKDDNFIVYPDPATDFITLKFNKQASGNVTYALFDETGRLLISGLARISNKGEEFPISIKDLPLGIYFLHLSSPDSRLNFPTTKVVKE